MTRRYLIALAAVAVARAGGSASAAAAAEPDDAEVLLRLIAREEAAVVAHGGGAVATHERDHAGALRTLLDALGRLAPRGPESAPAQDPVALERSLVEEYRTALLELRDPGILRTAGTILASHSQHHARARLDADLDPFASD